MELWPFSQGEIDSTVDGFVDTLFSDDAARGTLPEFTSDVSRAEYAEVRSEDFRGLRHLADRLGPDLIAGIVLYTGRPTLSFGERMQAMPISSVWQVG